MKQLILFVLLLAAPQIISVPASFEDLRTISGIIYFTNNTPHDVDTFPIELLTRDEKKLVKATTPNEHRFSITDIEPGEYILKITQPKRCTLRYRVDVRAESKTRLRVIMDAACAHDNGAIRELDEN